MKLPLYQIDAFTDRVFSGNPAAVCPMEKWPEDRLLQAIAGENALSETAFFVPEGDEYQIRWFTPTREVVLCGHATLAAAYVIFSLLDPGQDGVRFLSRSGPLHVNRDGELLAMDFPILPAERDEGGRELLGAALGVRPEELWRARDFMAVYGDEEAVRGLRPDMGQLAALDVFGTVATAPGRDCDFVSRFFAPAAGVPEDPVTGSTHCTLVPYWAERLGKRRLHARQVSARGGEMFCELQGERLIISGRAVMFMAGQLELPDER